MSKGIDIKSEHQQMIELIEKADLSKCDLNQLHTIVNLFMVLNVPMKEKQDE